MIYLIGLGLDDKEITEKGLEALEKAEVAYAEFYTNTKTIDIERLEEKTGTEIKPVERKDVEQNDLILKEGNEKDIAFLVSGDPLTATTHYDIKQRAKQKEINLEVIHAPSIFTSISETGLNIYKFGRTVTLPRNAKPQSIIEQIENNRSIGLHTLVLLDINYSAEKAARKLTEMNEEFEGEKIMVLERANSRTQKISFLNIENLSKDKLGDTPHCLIFPGELSHKEKENIKDYK